MICMSFKTVVYPVGLVWFKIPWISRTVAGPWPHKTRRISSSASVGRLEDLRMGKYYYEVIRSVNEFLRSQVAKIEVADIPGAYGDLAQSLTERIAAAATAKTK